MYKLALITTLLFSLYSVVQCQCDFSNCINCASASGCVWCSTYSGGPACITEAEKTVNCSIVGVDESYEDPLACPDYCQGYDCGECVDISLCGFCYDPGQFDCLRKDSINGKGCIDFRTNTSSDGCTPPTTCEQETICSNCTENLIYSCGWCYSDNAQDAFCYDMTSNNSACDNLTRNTFGRAEQCNDPCLDLNNECGQCTESTMGCGFCHDFNLCFGTDIQQWTQCKDYVTLANQSACDQRIACETLMGCAECVDNTFDTCSWCATSQTCVSLTGGGGTNSSTCEGGVSDQSQCLARANQDSLSSRTTTSFLF